MNVNDADGVRTRRLPLTEARRDGTTVLINEADAEQYVAAGWTVPPRVAARLGQHSRWSHELNLFADSDRDEAPFRRPVFRS